MTNKVNTVLYTGVTNNLVRRVIEHREGLVEGFTKRYHIHKLVYFESFNTALEAIAAEKKIKGWVRRKKIELIESKNPKWIDFGSEILR